MSKENLFVSDIHLSEDTPQVNDLFLSFLKTRAKNAEALYILGDLFNVWIGDDYKTELSKTLAQEIARLSQSGVKVFFLPGNRDFLLGVSYANKTQWQVLTEPTCIDLYQQPTLLMHGDLLCTNDKVYQRYRAFIRHPVVRFTTGLLPLNFRIKIANKLRKASKKHQTNIPYTNLDVNPLTVIHFMQKYNCTQLIHGHVHRQAITEVSLNSTQIAKRFVLGPWNKSGSILVCSPQSCHFETFLANSHAQ